MSALTSEQALALSVIICTYNRQALLEKCLECLTRQVAEFADKTEVIVVDNNCTDDTRRLVDRYRARHSWLKYIQEPKQGLSHARNRGAEIAVGTYLCYLDDDAIPSASYLSSLHDVIDRHRPDIFGGPIFPYYTTPKPSWFRDSFETRCHAPVTGFSSACSIPGGNYIIRADLLRALGNFSPNLGMIGNRLRLGEEREILEKYRREVPACRQRVFYSLESFIYHHVPLAKMRISYFMRRGYASGRAAVVIKREHPSVLPHLTRELLRTWFMDVPRSLRSAGSETSHPALAVQRGALIAGKITQHLQNLATRVINRPRSREHHNSHE